MTVSDRKVFCKDCRYWEAKTFVDPEGNVGQCRAKSPVSGKWPLTCAKDWCGEGRLPKPLVTIVFPRNTNGSP